MSDLNHPEPPADHSVKIPHLIFGLLFLGVAAVWALVVTDVITEDRLPVIIPALLIGAGVIGLAASLASGRNRRQRHQESLLHTPDHTTDHTPAQEPVAPVEPELDDHTQEIR